MGITVMVNIKELKVTIDENFVPVNLSQSASREYSLPKDFATSQQPSYSANLTKPLNQKYFTQPVSEDDEEEPDMRIFMK